LVACMRQNPIWILLAEVRSAEAVMAVRNSISSGHHVISTIHADKASSIPMRMYALLEGSQDIEQYLSSIHRYIQIGIYVKGYYSRALDRFQREIMEICEFYVDDDNKPKTNILYQKTLEGKVTLRNPTKRLIDYLAIGNVYFDTDDIFGLGDAETKEDTTGVRDSSEDNLANKKAVVSGSDDPFKMNETAPEGTGGAAPAQAAAPKAEATTAAPAQQATPAPATAAAPAQAPATQPAQAATVATAPASQTAQPTPAPAALSTAPAVAAQEPVPAAAQAQAVAPQQVAPAQAAAPVQAASPVQQPVQVQAVPQAAIMGASSSVQVQPVAVTPVAPAAATTQPVG